MKFTDEDDFSIQATRLAIYFAKEALSLFDTHAAEAAPDESRSNIFAPSQEITASDLTPQITHLPSHEIFALLCETALDNTKVWGGSYLSLQNHREVLEGLVHADFLSDFWQKVEESLLVDPSNSSEKDKKVKDFIKRKSLICNLWRNTISSSEEEEDVERDAEILGEEIMEWLATKNTAKSLHAPLKLEISRVFEKVTTILSHHPSQNLSLTNDTQHPTLSAPTLSHQKKP